MKVFKFYSGNLFYAYAADNEEKAKECLFNEIGIIEIEKTEEIPESEWDKKIINIWEDNDFEKEPYQESIRQTICGEEPQLIFTNDMSTF